MTTLLDGRRWLSLAAAFAMVVAVMAMGIPSAGAGKPAHDRDFRVTSVELVAMTDGTCVAKVWWEGLKGGRKINVEFDMRADLIGGPEYDGPGTTTSAAGTILEVKRGLTGETKRTGYAEYVFAFPYGPGAVTGEGFYHIQVRFWDRNGLYGDLGGTSPDGDMIYANWEYANNAAHCTA